MRPGKVLFLLDCLLLALVWPAILQFGCWGSECFSGTPDGLAAVLYPTADLLCFYALGLYRRDTLINTRDALARVPLAVCLGAVATACCIRVTCVSCRHTTSRRCRAQSRQSAMSLASPAPDRSPLTLWLPIRRAGPPAGPCPPQ